MFFMCMCVAVDCGSLKVERTRAKRKSSSETVAPVECVFCGQKEKDLSKM